MLVFSKPGTEDVGASALMLPWTRASTVKVAEFKIENYDQEPEYGDYARAYRDLRLVMQPIDPFDTEQDAYEGVTFRCKKIGDDGEAEEEYSVDPSSAQAINIGRLDRGASVDVEVTINHAAMSNDVNGYCYFRFDISFGDANSLTSTQMGEGTNPGDQFGAHQIGGPPNPLPETGLEAGDQQLLLIIYQLNADNEDLYSQLFEFE